MQVCKGRYAKGRYTKDRYTKEIRKEFSGRVFRDATGESCFPVPYHLRTHLLSELWLFKKNTEDSLKIAPPSVPTRFRVPGFSEKLRRIHWKLLIPPYLLTFEYPAFQKSYGGFVGNCSFLRIYSLSDSWLFKNGTEKSRVIVESSVSARFRSLGLSRKVRRIHWKSWFPPYQLAFGPLACQEWYGGSVGNREILRTMMIFS